MNAHKIRVAMQTRWKAAQERFIERTGGDPQATPEKYPAAFAEREATEDALRAEFLELTRGHT